MRDGLTTGRWVDVHETKGKRSGAYSWGAYGSHPGHPDELERDALGRLHAGARGRSRHAHLPGRPGADVPGCAIPDLPGRDRLDPERGPADLAPAGKIPAEKAMERFAILNRFADQIMGTHVRQTMFAEFERETHRIVEAAAATDPPATQRALRRSLPDLLAGHEYRRALARSAGAACRTSIWASTSTSTRPASRRHRRSPSRCGTKARRRSSESCGSSRAAARTIRCRC